jgi:hypothetical protein
MTQLCRPENQGLGSLHKQTGFSAFFNALQLKLLHIIFQNLVSIAKEAQLLTITNIRPVNMFNISKI